VSEKRRTLIFAALCRAIDQSQRISESNALMCDKEINRLCGARTGVMSVRDFSAQRIAVHCSQQQEMETPWIGSPQGEFPMPHVTTVSPLHFALTEAPVEDQPGFFRRLLAAMMASRQAQAEREIATFLRASGGKFTDESEREIERLLLAPKSRW
jgi:hypothetical protein